MTTGFIYLASASPRRRDLLGQIGVAFRAQVPAIVEEPWPDEPAGAYVERVAREKADAVWDQMRAEAPAPVLAADTAVVVDDQVLGKPADADEAAEMLARLSGRSHRVLTAVALRWQSDREVRLVASEVRFRATTVAERIAYCRTGEPLDKAGGYAIQGLGAVFVVHLTGSYSAVVGLPLDETAGLLARFGVPSWLAADS